MPEVSTNVIPPWFGPRAPVYPQVDQLIRVDKFAVKITDGPSGLAVYPAFTQQANMPNLTLRDRESCYLVEPNGIQLGPGFYDCRLCGNYLGLPCYYTTCCTSGGLSASSSSSH